MSFSPKTLDFLFENRINDSKAWFQAHKDDFNEYVKKPMEELCERLRPYIAEIDEQCNVTHISRIYRDTRFAKGKSIYRENMWCTYSHVRDLYKSLPAFYFDISAKGFEYGCGWYVASADTMNAYRSLILSDSPIFTAAQAAYDDQDTFTLYGDLYKRNRFPEESEEKCFWLNRKNTGLTALLTDWEIIFSDELADFAGKKMSETAAVYDFFMKAEEIAAKDRKGLSPSGHENS